MVLYNHGLSLECLTEGLTLPFQMHPIVQVEQNFMHVCIPRSFIYLSLFNIACALSVSCKVHALQIYTVGTVQCPIYHINAYNCLTYICGRIK